MTTKVYRWVWQWHADKVQMRLAEITMRVRNPMVINNFQRFGLTGPRHFSQLNDHLSHKYLMHNFVHFFWTQLHYYIEIFIKWKYEGYIFSSFSRYYSLDNSQKHKLDFSGLSLTLNKRHLQIKTLYLSDKQEEPSSQQQVV